MTLRRHVGQGFGCIAAFLGQKRRTCVLVASRSKDPVGSDDMLDLLDYSESENARDVGEREQSLSATMCFLAALAVIYGG
jgi:hypothetical protein